MHCIFILRISQITEKSLIKKKNNDNNSKEF